VTHHDHPPEGECPVSCPGWSEGALELYALQRRHDAMLAACRAADRIEFVIIAPATPGAELPEFLQGEELVRLNLVVGRDCPEVMLDEWGIRTNLTFRGRRNDCAIPWSGVKAGVLVAPPKKRPRFGLLAGGRAAGGPEAPSSTPTPVPSLAPTPAPASDPEAGPAPVPASAPTALPAPAPAVTEVPPLPPQDDGPPGGPPPPPRPRPVFGVIPGGKADKPD
jgi:hypothetical protein